MGLVIAGSRNKVFYYDLKTSSDPVQPLSADPLGPVPTLTHRDRLFIALANYSAGRPANNFKLTVTAESGNPINSELVRPTFPASAEVQNLDQRMFTGKDTALRDLVLPVQKRFKPFDIPKVTLSTILEVQTKKEETRTNGTTQSVEKKEVKELKLLDGVEYPIVRGLYRYNFNAGVVQSDHRDSEFVKVKVADDDPSTAGVNEQRFRIDELEQDRELEAVLAFTFYWKEVDILQPITFREALIPNPTLAFGMSKPQDNFFAGFSHSIARNIQLLWGFKFGKVTEVKPRNDVSEELDATAPLTRQVSDEAFFVGLSFNLQVVSKIFK